MKTKTKVRLLFLVAAVFFAGGALFMIGRILVPLDLNSANKTNVPTVKDPGDGNAETLVTLADFEGLWKKRLQGRPEPPPAPKAMVAETPKVLPKPSVTLPEMSLTGILYSENTSLALFNVGGQAVTRAVGEDVNGATVEKIDPDQVTLIYRDQTFVRKPE